MATHQRPPMAGNQPNTQRWIPPGGGNATAGNRANGPGWYPPGHPNAAGNQANAHRWVPPAGGNAAAGNRANGPGWYPPGHPNAAQAGGRANGPGWYPPGHPNRQPAAAPPPAPAGRNRPNRGEPVQTHQRPPFANAPAPPRPPPAPAPAAPPAPAREVHIHHHHTPVAAPAPAPAPPAPARNWYRYVPTLAPAAPAAPTPKPKKTWYSSVSPVAAPKPVVTRLESSEKKNYYYQDENGYLHCIPPGKPIPDDAPKPWQPPESSCSCCKHTTNANIPPVYKIVEAEAAPEPAPEPPKPVHIHHCCHHHHGTAPAPAPSTVEGPIIYHGKPPPVASTAHFVPYRPADDQQYWCKELDTTYTLKTHAQISATAMPGEWKYGKNGKPYWERQ